MRLTSGGTVTGEHGVGLLKRAGLSRELSPAVLEMHRAVKAALDPYHILNPARSSDWQDFCLRRAVAIEP